jgi:hypothetical protein
MRDEDEIIERYERELGPEPPGDGPPRRRSNRGFWIVVGAITAASAILVVEIFANREVGQRIARAQHDLRVAEAEARRVEASVGSFQGADAGSLDAAELDDGALSAVGPDEVSAGLGEVSVYADATTWAAAVSVRPRACFYLKLVAGEDEPRYGVGTVCTAREALDARDSRW